MTSSGAPHHRTVKSDCCCFKHAIPTRLSGTGRHIYLVEAQSSPTSSLQIIVVYPSVFLHINHAPSFNQLQQTRFWRVVSRISWVCTILTIIQSILLPFLQLLMSSFIGAHKRLSMSSRHKTSWCLDLCTKPNTKPHSSFKKPLCESLPILWQLGCINSDDNFYTLNVGRFFLLVVLCASEEALGDSCSQTLVCYRLLH